MTQMRNYVRDLPDSEKRLIVDGWTEFEKNNFVDDDAPLRHHTETFMESVGADEHLVLIWMQILAFEVYRYYAEQMFEMIDDPLSALNQMRAEFGCDEEN